MYEDAIDMNGKPISLCVNLKINNKNGTERDNPDKNVCCVFLCLLNFRISYGERKQMGLCLEMESQVSMKAG